MLNYSMEQSPSLEADRHPAISRNSLHFMETEDSSPHSQAIAICPYPQPD
jgi:hypothetical protein